MRCREILRHAAKDRELAKDLDRLRRTLYNNEEEWPEQWPQWPGPAGCGRDLKERGEQEQNPAHL
jgi:hypothetical protein